MKILIADDHDLLRETLRSYIEAEIDCTVALAADLDGALDAIRTDGPFDIVLLDYTMPGMNGFEGLNRAIAVNQARPVAIMSGTAPAGVAERAIDAGAAGFLPKTLPARSVVNAIRFMAAGERYLPHDMSRAVETSDAQSPYAQLLTPRERQVLQGLCRGESNKEIARVLGLGEPTVKLHVKQVCRKLEARNRTHAAMIARDAAFR